jgi:hypothetical protein
VAAAPELAQGLFPMPRVAAVTHLFTLGWVTTSIMGALYQFLPVALSRSIRWERLGYATLGLYAPGLAAMVLGLQQPHRPLLLAGVATFSAGLLLFALNLAATLRLARPRTLTWWCLAGAAAGLVATVVLGASLAGNLQWNYLGARRFAALGIHMHVALAGWVLLVVIGVGSRLLPMFLLSHGFSRRPAAVAAVLVAAGTAVLAALHHVPGPLVTWLGGGLIWAGTATFLLQAAAYARRAGKPKLDPGLRLAAAGGAFAIVALALAPFVMLRGVSDPGLATAYGTAAILGALGLFVAGHYYKILPFLVWFHRFGPLAGKRPLPTVAELYGRWTAEAAAALLALGAAGVVAGILLTHVALTRAGAWLFAAGSAVFIVQMAGIARRRPE